MQKYSAVLIDDETQANDMLQLALQMTCPEIHVAGVGISSAMAVQLVHKLHPDVLFLDIDIDAQDGFEVLQTLMQNEQIPYVVFVTAYLEYAHKAFQYNALDYLLKPVKRKELREAVDKFLRIKEQNTQKQSIRHFLNFQDQKLRFNHSRGFFLLHPNEILYCESDRNYAKIYLSADRYKLVSMNLATIQRMLPETDFWRISRYFLVNKNYVDEVNRIKKVCFLSKNDERIELKISPDFLKNID